MAKAKSSKNSVATPSDIIAAQQAARFRNMDYNHVALVDRKARTAGVPVHFSLQYLFDVNVIPMGIIIHLYGQKDNNKTTFYWELARLMQLYYGKPELFLTESKSSRGLVNAILGYVEENPRLSRVIYEYDDMQAWQAGLLQAVAARKELYLKGDKETKTKPGAFYPICYGIDSLTGQLLKSTGDKMEREGAAEREYATEAASLTKFLKKLAQAIAREPMIVVAINHMKVAPGQTPYQVNKRTIGGAQIKFQATYELELSQGPLIKVADPDPTHGLYIQGYDITITVDKNSLGEKRRTVVVPYRWHYEPSPWDKHVQVQRATFDWDAALVRIIMEQTATRKKTISKAESEEAAIIRKRIDQVVHVRPLPGKMYYSDSLKISKHKPVTESEMGRLIHEQPEMIEGLSKLFGIKRYTVWTPPDRCFYKLSQDLKSSVQTATVSTPKRTDTSAISTPPVKQAIKPTPAKGLMRPASKTQPIPVAKTQSKPVQSASPAAPSLTQRLATLAAGKQKPQASPKK